MVPMSKCATMLQPSITIEAATHAHSIHTRLFFRLCTAPNTTISESRSGYINPRPHKLCALTTVEILDTSAAPSFSRTAWFRSGVGLVGAFLLWAMCTKQIERVITVCRSQYLLLSTASPNNTNGAMGWAVKQESAREWNPPVVLIE